MPVLNPQWRFFLGLVCGFIVIVPVGTLLHESAHYLIARILGFEGYISYQSAIYTHLPGEGQALLDNRLMVTVAGPLQTMLTGLLGLALLWKSRTAIQQAQELRFGQWVMIFLSLFWLRQVMSICIWLYLWIRWGAQGMNADEVRIALYLNVPTWLILVLTGIAGGLIVAYVYLKFIPAGQKKIFLLAGITGCIAGYLIWFGWLGKILLPVQ